MLSTIPFWRRINRFRFKKRSKNIGTIIHNNKEANSDEEKAEVFCERLKTVFNENENERFDGEFKKKVDRFFDDDGIESSYTTIEKNIKPFSAKELDCAINRINNKTSVDSYGISNKILRKVSSIMKDKILKLFNNCLIFSKVPDEWKISTVIMLPKCSAGLTDPSKYRPISITACIARLFERLLLVRLQKHLNTNNIIINQQSGFRKNRSTKDNLIFLSQKIGECLRKKWNMLNIYFDIAGAFDKVWHRGLLYKMVKIKTPYYIVKIVENFLKDRAFTVKVGNVM
jgi:hypothetical protein